MNETQSYQIKPYARLLTMLGDQLISNERVALVELVKNSYDADASLVKISFNGFREIPLGDGKFEIEKTNSSSITIEDDGCGMTMDTIKKHWLNPATPEKKNRKKDAAITKKGRFLQGEKGIGRFAILKLGKKITITTRSEKPKESFESVIKYDFSEFDEDFSTGDGQNLMLDEISVQVAKQTPVHFVKRYISWGTISREAKPQGTLIEISNLKGEWNRNQIKSIAYDLSCLQSIFDTQEDGQLFVESHDGDNQFSVKIYINEKYHAEEDPRKRLNGLLENNSVYQITDGHFDDRTKRYSFVINGDRQFVDLTDNRITGYKIFRDYFGQHGEKLRDRKIFCGPFDFEFYIFDLTAKPGSQYHLGKEKDVIKRHRVYLYRDGIRVYPYGDEEDDWLQIDIKRGTVSAGMFPSNDQLVGCVKISHQRNPLLRDKTNREGLIQNGFATSDFITLIQLFIEYIHEEFYRKRYRETEKAKRQSGIVSNGEVEKSFDTLQNVLKDNPNALKVLACTRNLYTQEIRYLQKRVDTTEELAGVGLSVETSSHDIMAFMSKVLKNLDGLIRDISGCEKIDEDTLLKDLNAIRGGVSFIEAQLKDIQLLFKSSKQRRRQLVVKEILEKVAYIYRRILKKEKIKLNIITVGSPLVAKTTDAVLLQLLINLFDNSVYWLQPMDIPDKTIEVYLDGNAGQMIFSDNGPGVRKDDVPYIFEPFFSGKGEDGRGLGLYIARQLLERHAYSIELADIASEKRLSGANFVINFVANEENE